MNILFVCTGNICRSPVAEQILASKLMQAGIQGAVSVSSAGTSAMLGNAMDPLSADSMVKLGYAPTPRGAVQLTKDKVEQADLVLTATQDHRADVVDLSVRANRYVFTIKEFARLADYERSNRGAQPQDPDLMSRLSDTIALRGFAEPTDDTDIGDPWGLGFEVFDEVGEEIAAAVDRIYAWLS